MVMESLVSGRAQGKFMRQSLGRASEVHVIFIPGMGNGWKHSNQAYSFWQLLHLWFGRWYTFSNGGQEFNEYVHSAGGLCLMTGPPLPSSPSASSSSSLSVRSGLQGSRASSVH